MRSEVSASTVRTLFHDLMLGEPPARDAPEYLLGSTLGVGYAGLSRGGLPALLVPLSSAPGGVARTGGGCVLRPANDVAFSFEGRKWNQAAAILECSDPSVLDAFAVLALDVAVRSSPGAGSLGWDDVAELVDEWYTLFARRRSLSLEDEMGIWGEVWFLSQASNLDRLASGWFGPEGGSSDFVIGAVCVDVKTSRSRLRHFVSQTQVERPMGELKAFLVSLWVGLDPEAGVTLPALIDRVLTRSQDPTPVLKRLLETGYSPVDRHEYQRSFLLLEEPLWFAASHIPRVRLADPGVSHLRYMVMLNSDEALNQDDARALSTHFHGSHLSGIDLPAGLP